ncbi:hypothetical protein PISMIDRAFT_686755 [Pisolithus microcarpus 441]|uniref:Unplaced genomic scaffold scaffold_184, whole genome shotgun sequence n=1 Tax=Pisolithus microcarpus 441 TaxID=765257 RepID=A0A0C9XUM4_9AGAM|nr:hypothetical protein PISMIDRAFT_686755 [Pisolithus microcarpus 441]
MNRFTQLDEDSYRLPEGVERIAYDADSQRYLFRDRAGQLYQNEPGDEYGVLQPVKCPIPPRRSVTIIEHRDPALWENQSDEVPKTFDDILPSNYITSAPSLTPSAEDDSRSNDEKSPATTTYEKASLKHLISKVPKSLV